MSVHALVLAYWIGVLVVLGFIKETTEPREVPWLDCLGYMIGWPIWLGGMLAFFALMCAVAPFVVAFKLLRRTLSVLPPAEERQHG